MNKKNKARRAGALSRAKANDQRKRNEKARREGDETLAKLNAALQTALTLFEGDDADAVIDEPGPGYQEIIQGMEAEGNLLAGYVYGNGLRRKQANAQMLASGLVVRLQLVHFAYAAGVRLGEERAAKEYNASLTKIIKGQAEHVDEILSAWADDVSYDDWREGKDISARHGSTRVRYLEDLIRRAYNAGSISGDLLQEVAKALSDG